MLLFHDIVIDIIINFSFFIKQKITKSCKWLRDCFFYFFIKKKKTKTFKYLWDFFFFFFFFFFFVKKKKKSIIVSIVVFLGDKIAFLKM
jgi:hypothetical protein